MKELLAVPYSTLVKCPTRWIRVQGMRRDEVEGGIVDGRFQLVRVLGSGHFGTVWLAQDVNTKDELALKLLRSEAWDAPHVFERFEQEARILLGFNHPGIARAIAFSASERPYLALEYVEGTTLEREISSRAEADQLYRAPELIALLDPLFSAVAYAHGQGVVHRDLKPGNILLSRRGGPLRVKVVDFGIAKVLGGAPGDSTTEGRVVGTPTYLAPEQLNSDAIDARTDLFALGTILFELLTLRRTWLRASDGAPLRAHESDSTDARANSWIAMLVRICSGPRPRPSQWRSELSEEIDEVVMRAMAIDPRDRYQSVAELWEAARCALLPDRTELDAIPEDEPTATASSDWNERSTLEELSRTEPEEVSRTEADGERRSGAAQLIVPSWSLFDQREHDGAPDTLVAPAPAHPTTESSSARTQREPEVTHSPPRARARFIVVAPIALSLALVGLAGSRVLFPAPDESAEIVPSELTPVAKASTVAPLGPRPAAPERAKPAASEPAGGMPLGPSSAGAHRAAGPRRIAPDATARVKRSEASSPALVQPARPNPIGELSELLERANERPSDPAILGELSRGIVEASNGLSLGEERTFIQRCAITGALSYDAASLARCLDRLKKALSPAPH